MHFGLINGQRYPLSGLSALPVHEVVGSLIPTAPAVPPVGYCSADGMFIWKMTSDGSGYWARKAVADVCAGTWSGAGPTVVVMPGSDPLDTNFGPFRAGPFSLPAVPVQASYVRYIKFDGTAPIPEPAASYLNALLQIPPPTIKIPDSTQGTYDLSTSKGNLWDFAGWCDEPITQAAMRAWLSAMHFGPNDSIYLNWAPVRTVIGGLGAGCPHSGLPGFYEQMAAGWEDTTPVFAFKHPSDNSDWGIWLQFTNSGFNDSVMLEIIVSSFDHWKSFHQSSSRDLYNTISGWADDLANLTCAGLSKLSPQAASSNPYIAAAKISSMLVCDNPAPPPPITTLPPVVVAPWWQNPTILIGAAVAIGFFVLISGKSNST